MTALVCIAVTLLLTSAEVLRRPAGDVPSGLLLALLLASAVGLSAELLARPGSRRPWLWSVTAALPCLLAWPALDTAMRRALQVDHSLAVATAWAGACVPAAIAGLSVLRALSRWTPFGTPVRAALALSAGVGTLLATLVSTLAHMQTLAIHVVHLYLIGGFASFATRFRLLTLVPATAGFGVIAVFGPARYVELSAIFTWCAALGCGCAVQAAQLQRPRTPTWVLSLLAVGAFVGAHAVTRAAPGAYAAASGSGALSGLVHSAHVVSDVDRDGYGAVFAHRDCAPFDALVAPHRHELLDNFIDDNCRGGSADASLQSWARAQEAIHRPPPRLARDVVIVLIDALRYDVAHSDAMPTLRRWAAQGVDFTRAYSTSSFTASVLGGILAARHAPSIELRFYSRLSARPVTAPGGLAPWLRKLGYQTALAGRFPDTPLYYDDAYAGGFGISEYADQHVDAAVVEDAALSAWKRMDPARPRFMLVHHMQVHRLQPSFEAYRDNARSVDASLARLRQHIGDGVIWIVLADHGEEFREHGGSFHASSLYQEVLHVPLTILAPGLAPARIDTVSSLRSIMPTVMAAVGRAPAAGELGPYLCLKPPCRDMPAPAALELPDRHIHGLVLGDRKILRDLDRGHVEAFDLKADPGERSPLPAVPADLLDQLLRWEEAALGPRDDGFFWPYEQPAPWR